jgi:hypothetical protein
MSRRTLPLLLVVVLLLAVGALLAYRHKLAPAPAPVPPPPPPALALKGEEAEEAPEVGPRPALDVASLKFDRPELRQRFLDFDAAARRFAADVGGFAHRPYRQGGNFITAVWAKNADPDLPIALRGGGPPKEVHRIRVDTIVVPFPQAKAAGLGVELVAPGPDGWCVSFRYREATLQQVMGSGWGVTLYRWDPAKYGKLVPFRPQEQAKERLTLPLWGHAVADSGVQVGGRRPVEEDFLRHARSAAAMRDAYLADLAELEGLVAAFVADHKAQKKVYEEKYNGPGAPPHRLVALTAEEEAAELAKAKAHFAAQAKLMRDHHEAAYAAWRRSFPLERCWPQLDAAK